MAESTHKLRPLSQVLGEIAEESGRHFMAQISVTQGSRLAGLKPGEDIGLETHQATRS